MLGVQLFDRLPSGLALTPKGKHLLHGIAESLGIMDQTVSEVIEDTHHKLQLNVAFPPTFAHCLAAPLLTRFRAENTDIMLHLETPRTFGDMSRSSVDLAVVHSPPRVSEHVMDLLWLEYVTPMVHPELLDKSRSETPLEFLQRQELIHIRVPGGPHLTWTKWLLSQKLSVKPGQGLVFDTAHLAAQYVKSGRGVLLSDPKLFSEQIESGELAVPFPDMTLASGYGYYLMCRGDDLQNTGISRLRDWIIRQFVSERAPATDE